MRTMAVIALVLAACGSQRAGEAPTTSTPAPTDIASVATTAIATADPQKPLKHTSEGYEIPPAPEFSDGPIIDALKADLETLIGFLEGGHIDQPALTAVAGHGDVRTAWIFTDVLRFARPGEQSAGAVDALEQLTGLDIPGDDPGGVWKTSIDYLIAWDLPAIPGYVEYKERLFVAVEPAWAPFFADREATIDWRYVSWGGVFIDDRPLGSNGHCARGCIPALDDPSVTDASGGEWLDDDRVIFGVTVNGEARAYPKHQMETHEMINDSLGGRRIGIPYCTLCGSAQAYFTDSVPDGVETPVLRTSGLLSRSNKVMYDLISGSVLDTFTGEAVSGPLREAGIRLEQTTVVASTWGAWKESHPETTILAFDGGIGFVYLLDPLRGRDDGGPIFPVGNVDPRLDAQELVVGVVADSGRAVAFPTDTATDHLAAGGRIEFAGITIAMDGSGLLAFAPDGSPIAAHQAFWFAWSQFWPETEVWQP